MIMKKTLAILMSCLLLFSLLFSCAKEEAAVNEWKPAEIEEDLKAAVAQLPGTELEFKLLFEDRFFRCDWALISSKKEAKAFLRKWKKEKENEEPYLSLKKIDFDTYYLLVCPREGLKIADVPFLLDLIQQENNLVLVYRMKVIPGVIDDIELRQKQWGTTSFVLIRKSDWIYGNTLPDVYSTCYDKYGYMQTQNALSYDPVLPETQKEYPRENTNN